MTRSLLYAALGLAASGQPVTATRLERVLRAMEAPVPGEEIRLLAELASLLGGAVPASGPVPALPPDPPPPEPGAAPPPAARRSEGAGALYVYALVPAGIDWRPMDGVDGQSVFLVPHKRLAALVHRCAPEPYQSGEEETVRRWVSAHDGVVNRAMELAGTALPLGFDTIVKPTAEEDASAVLERWIDERYDDLLRRLAELQGKAEYGIQLIWDPEAATRELLASDPELQRLQADLAGKPANVARLYRHKLDRALDERLAARSKATADEVRQAVAPLCVALKEEPPKRAEEGQMILNLSVLLASDRVEAVGAILEEVSRRPGLRVRFTGPWPPYSFANLS